LIALTHAIDDSPVRSDACLSALAFAVQTSACWLDVIELERALIIEAATLATPTHEGDGLPPDLGSMDSVLALAHRPALPST